MNHNYASFEVPQCTGTSKRYTTSFRKLQLSLAVKFVLHHTKTWMENWRNPNLQPDPWQLKTITRNAKQVCHNHSTIIHITIAKHMASSPRDPSIISILKPHQTMEGLGDLTICWRDVDTTATTAAMNPLKFTFTSVTVQTPTPIMTTNTDIFTSLVYVLLCRSHSKTQTLGIILNLAICSQTNKKVSESVSQQAWRLCLHFAKSVMEKSKTVGNTLLSFHDQNCDFSESPTEFSVTPKTTNPLSDLSDLHHIMKNHHSERWCFDNHLIEPNGVQHETQIHGHNWCVWNQGE